MRIAGIDQGTTSTRALVINTDGAVHVAHAAQHRQIYPRDGWVEHDPEELFENLTACVNAAGKLDAIGIDNQGESCLAWDAETGAPLSPIIVWQDRRTLPMLQGLQKDGCEPETLARAGLPLDPYFSASKLAWLCDNLPQVREAYNDGRLRLGTTDAFFLDRLTGNFVTDVSTASRTSLMNLETLEWDAELCRLFGVPIECLPRIVPTTGEFGAMKTDYGLAPITASVVDQQAALFGFGCRRRGDAKITFGTGAFALMVTGAEIIRKPELGLLPTVAWQHSGKPAVYALDGGVFTASAAINWARTLGLFSDYEDINSFYTPPAIESGLAFVPALAGLGCPHWLPNARGIWTGLSLDHKPEQLVQAILEGIAFRANEVVGAMASCVPRPDALYVDGGMSKNPYFVQFLADVTGAHIRPAHMPELTGLGTALLAAVPLECDIFPSADFGDIAPRPRPAEEVVRFRQAVKFSGTWAQNS
ncbi:FGGY-family carbohydrate kinase [Thalassorhabdomicrobium marinisediminis]|uniref:ATP:glycerol 3-phosphotransferase n=1 Tax=Thalassorhabdomicrobium marinisediminis TaxID=2170577 RepID=A0A2T7FU58_9RHOB|nr:FGGY family carbohydrate kinase [Thalassorhabdomicrobium marinisediminis]PVA05704.1 glycerol kinase [Thalassorhabdomicrobium marinisediminis]